MLTTPRLDRLPRKLPTLLPLTASELSAFEQEIDRLVTTGDHVAPGTQPLLPRKPLLDPRLTQRRRPV